MNPGQIQNVTPMPRPGDPSPGEDELPDGLSGQSSGHVTERDRNKSRVMALAIASLVHVFLFVLLAWLVISNFEDDEVELYPMVSIVTKKIQETEDGGFQVKYHTMDWMLWIGIDILF